MACNDRYSSNCYDSCDQIEGIFEAASNLIQYRDIIEKWLHGGQNETVQIGGEQVKTLLGLIADIKQLVGVLPDGRTIILDDKKKILSVLLASGGGIKVKAEGGLYVDVEEILVLGGGLAKDEDGKIYVDFSQMPTDKFEALLKQIRVPVWLMANKNFYVNGATGSDTLDDGRGLSAGMPFKTLQACINYVTDNYNVSRYIAYINLAPGNYPGQFYLPNFSYTTGGIVIQSSSEKAVLTYDGVATTIVHVLNGNWSLNNVGIKTTIRNNPSSQINSAYIVTCSDGYCTIDGVNINASYGDSEITNSCEIDVLRSTGGTITINSLDVVSSRNNENAKIYILYASNGGSIKLNDRNTSPSNTLTLSGVADVIAQTVNLGRISCSASGAAYPFTIVDNGITSTTKYRCLGGGVINTFGKGPDFFPGTNPGTAEASTYSWYA